MLIIRTGFQGHTKTLNSIKEIDTRAHEMGRTVYYCNVTGFNPDHPAIKAKWVLFDSPEKWFELPANAIIVIDEAQTWFRVRPQGSKVPDYATRLEIMRKDGHELHLITQNPKFIDAHMRGLCSRHIHYHRPNDGPWVKRWEFQKVQLDANDRLSFPDGESSRIGIDSAYFGCYESVKEGATHHFKFRLPKAALALGFVALIVGGIGFYLYDRLSGFAEAGQPGAVQQSTVAPGAAPGAIPVQPAPSSEPRPKTAAEYVAERTPRVPGVASSAPIYDELTRPVSFPKPACYATSSDEALNRKRKTLALGNRDGKLHGCSCVSQQGTRMDVPFDACMNMVQNGAFDPTRPDQQFQARSAEGGPEAPRAAGTPSAAPEPVPVASRSDRSTGAGWRSISGYQGSSVAVSGISPETDARGMNLKP